MVSEAECQRALDEFSTELIALPHVQGVGVGRAEHGYRVNVYVDEPEVIGVPDHVELSDPSRTVPLHVVYVADIQLQ